VSELDFLRIHQCIDLEEKHLVCFEAQRSPDNACKVMEKANQNTRAAVNNWPSV